jgi:glyoxylase-like metal-dependent hydrolase (beta-lactamase superfamily II)
LGQTRSVQRCPPHDRFSQGRTFAGAHGTAVSRQYPTRPCGPSPIMLDIGAEQLRLLPQTPAHTDGDVAVFLPASNVLVMGDLFTNGSYPVIDESSGGSLRGMVEAVEELLAIIDGNSVVVPGHGAAADRAGLLAFSRHAAQDRGSHSGVGRRPTRNGCDHVGPTDRRVRSVMGAGLCHGPAFHPHGARRNGSQLDSRRAAVRRTV